MHVLVLVCRYSGVHVLNCANTVTEPAPEDARPLTVAKMDRRRVTESACACNCSSVSADSISGAPRLCHFCLYHFWLYEVGCPSLSKRDLDTLKGMFQKQSTGPKPALLAFLGSHALEPV